MIAQMILDVLYLAIGAAITLAFLATGLALIFVAGLIAKRQR